MLHLPSEKKLERYVQIETNTELTSLFKLIIQRKDFAYAPVFYLIKILDPRDRGMSLNEEKKLEGMRVLTGQVLKNPLFTPFMDEVCDHLLYF